MKFGNFQITLQATWNTIAHSNQAYGEINVSLKYIA